MQFPAVRGPYVSLAPMTSKFAMEFEGPYRIPIVEWLINEKSYDLARF